MGQTAAGDWGCKGFMDGVITCGSKNNKTLLKQRNMMRVFFGARGFAHSGSSASGSGRGGWIVVLIAAQRSLHTPGFQINLAPIVFHDGLDLVSVL